MSLNRKTILNDEAYLRQVSVDVSFDDDNYMEYIEALKEYCKNNAVYAMAPVQIGIPKRLIYMKNTTSDMSKNKDSNYDEANILINPVIISAKGRTKFLERCESCLDFVGTVTRPYMVEVEYYDVSGRKVHDVFEGFKATVFCHEYDHLNGALHIDLAEDVCEMTLEEAKAYREEHPYEVISKDDDYQLIKRK